MEDFFFLSPGKSEEEIIENEITKRGFTDKVVFEDLKDIIQRSKMEENSKQGKCWVIHVWLDFDVGYMG